MLNYANAVVIAHIRQPINGCPKYDLLSLFLLDNIENIQYYSQLLLHKSLLLIKQIFYPVQINSFAISHINL